MWYKIKQYIIFLLKSTNQHGVHSPFVYNLITKCFYDKKNHKQYALINKYRTQLLKNNAIINVKDFGAGSRVFKSNLRTVSNIAKYAGISKKRGQLLYRLVNYFNTENILELGTSLGLATFVLHLGNTNANIITIEGCPETSKIANHQFDKFQFKNIDLRVNNFESELALLKNKPFDFVYIDGNHQKEATLANFESLLNSTHNNSVFIFDDIHWSKGMTEAWETIKNHNKVTVTIDTFYWGIVFFRIEQEKEHFVIRA